MHLSFKSIVKDFTLKVYALWNSKIAYFIHYMLGLESLNYVQEYKGLP